MKRILTILSILVVSIVSYSQSYNYFIAGNDTLKGADTIYHRTDLLIQSSNFIGIQVSADTISGIPGGYSIIQASVDGKKWATLSTTDLVIYTSGNDTMNYSVNEVGLWGISGLPFNYFRSMNVGSVGDTLIIKTVYQTKKY